MKISSSIRAAYDRQFDLNKKLEVRVKELMGDGNSGRWFYSARVKRLESFAQKIETGRFIPSALEDFFACSIVVENRSAILEGKNLVERFCHIEYQRPEDEKETHKPPEIFSFDDLRLYVRLKPLDSSPPSELNGVIFEIQIKTFLQYAWSIATHDLIYKGTSVDWGKARLAFQIKAMLENAEISIEQVDSISKSSALAMIDPKTAQLKSIINWLQNTWASEYLPTDLVRLGTTTLDVLAVLRLNLKDIEEAVKIDTDEGLGSKSQNLSPYEVIIKAIAKNKRSHLEDFIQGKYRSKKKLFITPEMELDQLISGATDRIVFAIT